MKLFSGVLTLTLALVISGVAGYFSVIGLAHLFAGAFWPVVVMGSALETGKIVASTWLKANWSNPSVSRLHKLYLGFATGVLMLITSVGIYGYLAKGHLEQEAPLASIEIQLAQIEDRITQASSTRTRLEQRQAQLDQSVSTMLGAAKTAKEAQAADRARQSQKKDRLELQKQIITLNDEINRLTASMVPLKLQVSDVSAKLGPVKYVAQLFGWRDTNTAVQMVILMIMFVFDPLAIVLILSGTVTIAEYLNERRAQRAYVERKREVASLVVDAPVAVPVAAETPPGAVPTPEAPAPTVSTEPAVAAPMGEPLTYAQPNVQSKTQAPVLAADFTARYSLLPSLEGQVYSAPVAHVDWQLGDKPTVVVNGALTEPVVAPVVPLDAGFSGFAEDRLPKPN